jgi:hypothetical protein
MLFSRAVATGAIAPESRSLGSQRSTRVPFLSQRFSGLRACSAVPRAHSPAGQRACPPRTRDLYGPEAAGSVPGLFFSLGRWCGWLRSSRSDLWLRSRRNLLRSRRNLLRSSLWSRGLCILGRLHSLAPRLGSWRNWLRCRVESGGSQGRSRCRGRRRGRSRGISSRLHGCESWSGKPLYFTPRPKRAGSC